MSDFIPVQADIFLTTILCGLGMGIIYDTIRIARRIISHSNIAIAIEDIIYWISSSILLFNLLYSKNDGVIRGFSILGVMIGLCSHYIIISKLYVTAAVWIINKIKKLIWYLLKLVTAPIRWSFSFLAKLIKKPGNYIIKQLKKLVNQVTIKIRENKEQKRIAVSEARQNKNENLNKNNNKNRNKKNDNKIIKNEIKIRSKTEVVDKASKANKANKANKAHKNVKSKVKTQIIHKAKIKH